VRKDMIDSLIEQLQRYYPSTIGNKPIKNHQIDISLFDWIQPSVLPPSVFELDTATRGSVLKMCEAYGWRFTDVWNQWEDVMKNKIIPHVDYARLKTLKTSVFWSNWLTVDHIEWEKYPAVHKFLETALVMPATSAHVERGFSALKHFKYDRRSTMTTKTLDIYLRLKINGPDPADFKQIVHAQLWQKQGHMLSDSESTSFPPQNPRLRMTDEEKNVEEGLNDNEIEDIDETETYKSSLF
jgi:hypothetical protein